MQPNQEDLREVKRLLAAGSTPYVESMLRDEIAKITEILQKETVEAPKPVEKVPEPTPAPVAPVAAKKPIVPITSYSFSDDKMDCLVIIHDVKGLEGAVITFEPMPKTFSITIDREAANLPTMKLTVTPLLHNVVPEKCRYRIKRDMIMITLQKKKEKKWHAVKKDEMDLVKKKRKNELHPPLNGNSDAAVMNMMKILYEEGDDEMRRTIQKAMWESKNKKPEEEKK